MRIIGIDPSSKKIAIALYDTDYKYFSIVAKSYRGTSAFAVKDTIAAYDMTLNLMSNFSNIDIVYLESVILSSHKSGILPQAYASGAIQAALASLEKPIELVVPTAWKHCVMKKGGATKQQISDFLQENFNQAFNQCSTRGKHDQDKVDACMIALYGAWKHNKIVL